MEYIQELEKSLKPIKLNPIEKLQKFKEDISQSSTLVIKKDQIRGISTGSERTNKRKLQPLAMSPGRVAVIKGASNTSSVHSYQKQ